MGACCNGKKCEQSELDLQSLDKQSGEILNNDGVDDLMLAGASGKLREESLRKARQKGLLSLTEKRDEDPVPEGQLPINTPTFGQLGKKPEPFRFDPKEAVLKEVTEEHTFGGVATGTEGVSLA